MKNVGRSKRANRTKQARRDKWRPPKETHKVVFRMPKFGKYIGK